MPKKPNKVTYNCHVCPNKYTRASYLDNHIRKCHEEEYNKLPKIEGTFRRIMPKEGHSEQAEPSQPKAPHGPAKAGDASSKVIVFNVAERVAALREAANPTPPTDPKTSIDTAAKGADLLRAYAKTVRWIPQAQWPDAEKFARDMEGLAFGLEFLLNDLQYTDYWAVKEKAKKWDDLARILPTIESFLRLALETEAKRVQAPDNH